MQDKCSVLSPLQASIAKPLAAIYRGHISSLNWLSGFPDRPGARPDVLASAVPNEHIHSAIHPEMPFCRIIISELRWSDSLALPLTMAARFGENVQLLRERGRASNRETLAC